MRISHDRREPCRAASVCVSVLPDQPCHQGCQRGLGHTGPALTGRVPCTAKIQVNRSAQRGAPATRRGPVTQQPGWGGSSWAKLNAESIVAAETLLSCIVIVAAGEAIGSAWKPSPRPDSRVRMKTPTMSHQYSVPGLQGAVAATRPAL
jgi:hypothetical protein